jgi:hypothetical protein
VDCDVHAKQDKIRREYKAKGVRNVDEKVPSRTWQVHIGAPGFWHTKQRFFTCQSEELVWGDQERECECN